MSVINLKLTCVPNEIQKEEIVNFFTELDKNVVITFTKNKNNENLPVVFIYVKDIGFHLDFFKKNRNPPFAEKIGKQMFLDKGFDEKYHNIISALDKDNKFDKDLILDYYSKFNTSMAELDKTLIVSKNVSIQLKGSYPYIYSHKNIIYVIFDENTNDGRIAALFCFDTPCKLFFSFTKKIYFNLQ